MVLVSLMAAAYLVKTHVEFIGADGLGRLVMDEAARCTLSIYENIWVATDEKKLSLDAFAIVVRFWEMITGLRRVVG